jgi:hypothetical protein
LRYHQKFYFRHSRIPDSAQHIHCHRLVDEGPEKRTHFPVRLYRLTWFYSRYSILIRTDRLAFGKTILFSEINIKFCQRFVQSGWTMLSHHDPVDGNSSGQRRLHGSCGWLCHVPVDRSYLPGQQGNVQGY